MALCYPLKMLYKVVIFTALVWFWRYCGTLKFEHVRNRSALGLHLYGFFVGNTANSDITSRWFCGRLNVKEVVNANVWLEFACTHIFKFMCISMNCQGKFNNMWHLLMLCQIQIRKFVQIRYSLWTSNKVS